MNFLSIYGIRKLKQAQDSNRGHLMVMEYSYLTVCVPYTVSGVFVCGNLLKASCIIDTTPPWHERMPHMCPCHHFVGKYHEMSFYDHCYNLLPDLSKLNSDGIGEKPNKMYKKNFLRKFIASCAKNPSHCLH